MKRVAGKMKMSPIGTFLPFTASSRQLLEVERTCRRHRRTDAIDPTETLAAQNAVMHNARGAGGGREGRSSGGVAYETSEAA